MPRCNKRKTEAVKPHIHAPSPFSKRGTITIVPYEDFICMHAFQRDDYHRPLPGLLY